MVLVLDDTNIARYRDVMEKVYLFRHKLFVERLRWEECRLAYGRDIDEFDRAGCIHLVRMVGEKVTAYARLLPTTRPHLLTEIYPHLVQVGQAPSGPRVYEWTCCGTLPSRRDGPIGIVDPAIAEIFTATAEVARARVMDGLLAQTHPILINRLMSSGWDVEPLGLPTKYLGHAIVAVYARLTADTVATSRRFFGLACAPITEERIATVPTSTPLPFPSPLSAPLPGTEIRLPA